MTAQKKENSTTGLEIAVIGMAGRFPGANNIEEFWDNLKNGIESISFFSEDELIQAGIATDLIKDPNYVKAKGNVSNPEYFDAAFFDYPPADAQIMDPQIRIFHECVWEALENAGYDPYTYQGLIGLYAGASSNPIWEALTLFSLSNSDMATSFNAAQLSNKDFLTTLLSYKLNLKGPSMLIQTACSTSLAAVHVACRELLIGGCNMAIAGGVSISLPPKNGYLYQEGMILSPDGHCRAFDAEAKGTVGGEGVGVVILKRLEDALEDRDHICAVIKGTGANNDGSRKVGYTAPSVDGQAQMLKTVYYMAEVAPESVGYIEAHGTGTVLGDPIEIEALKSAFKITKRNSCAIGSVKTNIGHLDAAAGVAGLIKTILALQYKQIPASLNYRSPNPKIDFDNSPFFVNQELREWSNDSVPLRAGVSSFGIGGTNVHVILEEAPEKEEPVAGRPWQLLVLSAKTPTALTKLSENLAGYLENNPTVNLADLSYTLQVGRAQFQNRRTILSSTSEAAIAQLRTPNFPSQVEIVKQKIVFMFPGQGSQYVNMGRELYQKEVAFREEMDRCLEILKPMLPFDLQAILYPETDHVDDFSITDTLVTQPILFIFEYALARLMIKWGIYPDAMIGHSIGEYVAACLAGVFSLEDALAMVTLRGKLMQEMPSGAMLSVPLSPTEVTPLLTGDISLAAINSSSLCVLAGSTAAIEALEKELNKIGCQGIKLHTSQAFHSQMMEPILPTFIQRLKQFKFNKPVIPYLSNVTGKWISVQDATNSEYWAKHLRGTVKFADGLSELLHNDHNVFMEIGPGRVLSTFVKQHRDYKAERLVINLIRHPLEELTDQYVLFQQLGKLWSIGLNLNWEKVYQSEKRQRIPLPSYPFERQRYWIERDLFDQDFIKSSLFPKQTKNTIDNWFYLSSWKRKELLTNQTRANHQHCLLFINENQLVVRLVERLQSEFQEVTIVRIGPNFAKLENNSYTINPSEKNDYYLLCNDLNSRNQFPEVIGHLWNVTEFTQSDLNIEIVSENQEIGFYSLLYLAQALYQHRFQQEIEIIVGSTNLQGTIGNEIIDPSKATLLGLCKVIPQEYSNLRCRNIDIPLPDPTLNQENDLVKHLTKEFLTQFIEPVIAYRNNIRWVQIFEPIPSKIWETLTETESGVSKFKKNGVYMLTGGLGKIGLFLAKYLVETMNAKIILVSHSVFPAKEEWNSWLITHTSNELISQRIQKIKEIEAISTDILIYQADLANPKELAKIVLTVEEKFGKINGVIHAAGITEANLIGEIAKEECEKHFQAKVYGLLGLAEIFQHKDLDFCILMSSLSSVLGGLGFASYAAANSFMDAFVQRMNLIQNCSWISINWDGWNFNAENINNQSGGQDLVDLAISPTEGLEALQRILSLSAINQVIVSISPLEERLKKWVKFETVDIANNLKNKETQYTRPDLSNLYLAPQNEIEEKLVIIWQDVLGIEQIGVNDNFFELGGHSLKATSLVSRIHKGLGIELPLLKVFQTPTIKELAQYIGQAEQANYTNINPVAEQEYYPVSSAQKRLYLINLMEGPSTTYNMPAVMTIEGKLDRKRLTAAFQTLIQRHESLRTSFELVNGEPIQKIHSQIKMDLSYQTASEEQTPAIIQSLIRPFDLSQAPLLRVGLIKQNDRAHEGAKHILVYDMHHIISDGVTISIIIKELASIYNGAVLPELRIQYKDFAVWQNELIRTGVIKQQEEYWLKAFSGEIPVLNLPTDYPRPSYQSFEGDRITFEAGETITRGLSAIAAKTGATAYMVLLAAYNVLLSKYSGQEDIVIGSPIAGRQHADLGNIVGMFVNTLALRNYPAGNKTYTEFLNEVKENALQVYENQDYQFEELVEQVNVRRDFSRNPLFDVMFILQNIEMAAIDLAGLQIKPYEFENQVSKFDLTLIAIETERNILFTLEYSTKLFRLETIERLSTHFSNILQAIVANPEVKLTEIEILTESEKQRILVEFNDTGTEYPQEKTIHQLFEEQVERTPENIAVVFQEKKLTYRELNERANCLAHELRNQGIGPDTIVAIMIERSLEMMIGLMAILKAGGAYLPIDPNYPQDRIAFMLADSKARVMLTQRSFKASYQMELAAIDVAEANIYRNNSENPANLNQSSDLAYVIYTSGSTGKPKGIMIEHRNVTNFIAGMTRMIDFRAHKNILGLTTISFDIFVLETLVPLTNGLTIVIADEKEQNDPKLLGELISQKQIEILQATPSRMQMLIQEKDGLSYIENIKVLMVGGEAFPKTLLEHLKPVNGMRIYNMYGPTETTVWSTVKELTDSTEISIGKPIANTQVYVVNPCNQIQPIGIVGELWIAGDGLARGYLDRPELMVEKYILNPLNPGKRVYRTGDLARFLPNGEIEFLGRIDHQVKIRGYRIELGEIENRILSHDAIKETVVVARAEANGNQYLCAYLVGERDLTVPELREHLVKELPEYMIPSFFIQLEKLPLTPNGKIDRKALPQPDGSIISSVRYEAPRNEVEARMVAIWKEVLGFETIGIHDNFFELGGHSLKAMLLVSQILKTFQVEVPLREVFRMQTIKELAEYIQKAEQASFRNINPVETREYYPVSSAQKRLYLIHRLEGPSTTYNIPAVMEIEGELDRNRLERAFQALIGRHEALRTSFELIDGELVQKVHSQVTMTINYQEVTEEAIPEVISSLIRLFDLSQAPLFRVGLIKQSGRTHERAKYILVYDMHHIISDGITISIIIKELAGIYNGEALPELRIQYKDFAVWQNELIRTGVIQKQEEYWLKAFSGEIQVLNLPTDHPRPSYQSFEGDRISFEAGAAITKGVGAIAAKTGATPYMVLLAAYNILLSKYSGQEDIVIGSPIAGRQHADLGNIVGMFVNTLALRNYPAGNKSYLEFLNEVKENALLAYENQDYQFEELVEKVSVRRDFSRNPLFDVMLVLQNIEMAGIDLTGLRIKPYPFNNQVAKFDLTLTAIETERNILFTLEYSTKLFRTETIERLSSHFNNILQAIVANPEVKLAEIEMLTEVEKNRILVEFNDTGTDYPKEKTIHQVFEEQVERTPDQMAIIFKDQQLTYRELNQRSNQLARTLREKGVKVDVIIGIMVERSLEMVIGMLGVLKAGGAYLPIDPTYPEERIRFMLEDSEIRILLTQQQLLGKNLSVAELIALDDQDIYHPDHNNLPCKNQFSDLAYIIYTSGSTGRPKGVMIEHHGVTNLNIAFSKAFHINEEDRVIQFASNSFDASVDEIFTSLLAGASLYIVDRETIEDLVLFENFITQNQITIATLPPTYLIYLNPERLTSLRILKVAGSASTYDLYTQWKGRGLFINAYGPTEGTVCSTIWDSTDGRQVSGIIPIGKPISNFQIYIVDHNNQIVPIGTPGELCIAGAGLARGYLNRPELTLEKFISFSFQPGEKAYKTGDLARWLPDGNIEFLGRIDHQVKIRGFRIELGEIESQLLKHQLIKEAIVIDKDNQEGKYLCAYIVTDGELTTLELRSFLSQELPDYMIPATFVNLESLPLTPNGKVDRKALPELEGNLKSGIAYEAPSTETETKLAQIWQMILNVETIGINDNFFELGGHSLKATVMVSQILKTFQVEVPLREIFRMQTIQEQAEYIQKAEQASFRNINPVEAREYYPVSSAQKRLYLIHRMEGPSTTYNMPAVMEIEGELDRSRLERAFQTLIGRHDALRTSFELVEGEPVQKVHSQVAMTISYQEVTDEVIPEVISSLIRPFDLGQAPLLRVGLIKQSGRTYEGDKHILVFDMHHIISDGITISIIIKELAGIYNGETIPELRIQYKDFAVWQNELIRTGVIQKQEEYWLKAFSGEIPVLNLPTDHPRPSYQSFEGDRISFEAGAAISRGVGAIAAKTGATAYMVLLAAYNILLAKYCGQEDIVVGSPIAGRQHADLGNIVGMFVNTLALRNYPAGNKNYLEFLNEVKENALKAYENQEYQFEELVEQVKVRRDFSRNPLFDVMLVLQNIEMRAIDLTGLRIKPYPFNNQVAKFDLTLTAIETERNILFTLEYSTKLFRTETIERLSSHFSNILQVIVANPEVKLAEIEMLTEAEKNRILVEFNDTGTDYPKEKTIHQVFEEQVERTPDQMAIIFKDQQLTYREFNERANCLARELRNQGIGPDTIVAIMIERSLEMMVGLMAILKSGGAYLPIDPTYPPERISFMLEDSKARILLTQNSFKARYQKDLTTIDVADESVYRNSGENLTNLNQSGNLAYVIYTSGSTGKPKGIMIEHRNVTNFITGMTKTIDFTVHKTILCLTTISFDIFVLETLVPLTNGLSIVIAGEIEQNDPRLLGELITRNEIEMLQATPSRMQMLIQEKDGLRNMKPIKVLMVGGEAFPKPLLETLKQIKSMRIYNMYGPTETTVWSTVKELTETEEISIGKPIANTQVYVVNKANQPQPIGVAGELWIGGDGLARGYLDRPELMAEKYIVNPLNPGTRVYRTGDLARFLPNGEIEFQGRLDHQVKIRGYRIELGEIENRLLKYDPVKETIVVAKAEGNGNQYLCAYVVGDREITVLELREHLSKELPDYMIPSFFIQLEKLPLTPNGKIDRKALPESDGSIVSHVIYEAPRNEPEEKLVKIWQEVLGFETIGINDNFFELGGHSLKAMVLVSQILKTFQVEVPLREVFRMQTIKELAEYIQKAEQANYRNINPVEVREYYPVSSAQKRLYLIHRLEGPSTTYNMPAVMEIEGELDRNRLERAFQTLIGRHEALRTSFELVDGEPVQKVHSQVEMTISDQEVTDKAIPEVISSLIRPFDLNQAPLLRVGLIKQNDRAHEGAKHILVYDMHHIISDGVTISIIIKELASIYNGAVLPELRIQYKDFAVWQNELIRTGVIKQQEEYWLKAFSGEIPVLNLPTDHPRPSYQSFEGDRITFEAGETITRGLSTIAAKTGATAYMVLLAAYNVLLSKYSGQEDIIIGSPIAGRQHADMGNIVGMFVNTLALRNYPAENKSYLEFLTEVKENSLQAYENQEYQFEELVEQVKVRRDFSRNPLFDVMFVLQNIQMAGIDLTGLRIKPYPFNNQVAKFDLTLTAIETKDNILFTLEYSTKLFRPETIERFSSHFSNILQAIVANPEVKLAEIEMLTEAEKNRILVEFNATETDYPREKTIHQFFEAQVERTPDKIAIIFKDQQLTYREFNERANCLARELRNQGIGPDTIVAIMIERSLEMMVGLMAILKSGGAYLPIDPTYPPERISFMLEDSKARILLTQNSFKARYQTDLTTIDVADESVYRNSGENLTNLNQSGNLAYVIYTSGSTGKPKGIMIEHRNVTNFIAGMTSTIDFAAHKTILCLTTISFDIFVLETMVPLTNGLTIVIAGEAEQNDPSVLGELISQKQIEILQATPSRMQMLTQEKDGLRNMKPIKVLMVGGEAFPKPLLETLKQIKGMRIYNMYGPTETTVWSTVKELTETEEISIGKPIANTQVYVVNKANQPQPIGVAGELWIGGDGLARGYLDRPELMEEKYIQNPLERGERVYRTGDLARFSPNGEIEFLGRIDHQVKIRGYRIELGEIENRLLSHEAVKETVVVAKAETNGNQYLCAYVVGDRELTIPELREHLAKELPEYMIPSYFIQLEKLPHTPNGKVDRKELPDPKLFHIQNDEYLEPRNETEQELVKVWQEVLEIDRISITDNFFLIGGNSIKAVQVIARLNEYSLNIQELLQHSTIAELSEYIHKEKTKKEQREIGNHRTINQSFHSSQIRQKMLDGIEPYNEVFYKNCFYNALFPVIRYLGREPLAFMVEDVFKYDLSKDSKMKLDVDFIPGRDILETFSDLEIEVNVKEQSSNIINDTIDALLNHRPVIIPVDCYYEPIREDTYQKIHWAHSLLFYGFDLDKQTFNIIEHSDINSLDYQKKEIHFSDVEKAYHGYLNYFGEQAKWSFYDFRELNENHTQKSLAYQTMLAHNVLSNKALINDGLKMLHNFTDHFESLSNSQTEMLLNIENIIFGINNIIKWKSAERYRFGKLFEEQTPILNQIADLENKWRMIKLNLERYKESPRPNLLVKIHKYLQEIYQIDLYVFQEMVKLLSRDVISQGTEHVEIIA